ncbi:MAG: Uma2 family endonuclease, partial [Thermodesulfovibrionales bacterium]|nr:Uma2 family endonuclease [Thermodesulfovibrionales bacterium]
VYNMSPAPGTRHQMILNKLNIIISRQSHLLKGCQIFIAPTDVVLSEYDVVQPDILVVCDRAKITERNIQGVPDLVIEVLSPNTALKDKREKKALYERYGVREYIIVDPIGQYAERFFLQDNTNYGLPDIFGHLETLSLKSFEGIDVNLSDVFEF